jgi:hypothetical protein
LALSEEAKGKQERAFLKKSAAKNFYEFGQWATAPAMPPGQKKRSFLLPRAGRLFFQKRSASLTYV